MSAEQPASKDKLCADCAGWDIEWMYQCQKHKGVEYCRGCACPYCAEDDLDTDDTIEQVIIAEGTDHHD